MTAKQTWDAGGKGLRYLAEGPVNSQDPMKRKTDNVQSGDVSSLSRPDKQDSAAKAKSQKRSKRSKDNPACEETSDERATASSAELEQPIAVRLKDSILNILSRRAPDKTC